jgi:hypothetical protein
MLSNSSRVHYCMSPLLFSPEWRAQVAHIRRPQDMVQEATGASAACSMHECSDTTQRQRHLTTATVARPEQTATRHKSSIASIRRSSTHNLFASHEPVKDAALERIDSSEGVVIGADRRWHVQIQHMFIDEYTTYLLSNTGAQLLRVVDRSVHSLCTLSPSCAAASRLA